MPPASVVAALVMEITYGMNIVSNEDRFLAASTGAAETAKIAAIPGTFLVNTIPICASHDVLEISSSPTYDCRQ